MTSFLVTHKSSSFIRQRVLFCGIVMAFLSFLFDSVAGNICILKSRAIADRYF